MSPGESLEPGHYEEWADNGSFAAWPDGTQGSSIQISRGAERLAFVAYLTCDAEGGCTVEAQLTNTSGRLMRFQSGLAVDLTVSRCDGTGGTVVLMAGDASVTELTEDASVTVTEGVALDEPVQYCLAARTSIELV